MNVVEMEILGQKLAVKSNEEEEHIRAVEAYLNQKVDEIRGGTKAVSTLDMALLAALNVTGELIKIRETIERIDKRSEELSLLIDRRME